MCIRDREWAGRVSLKWQQRRCSGIPRHLPLVAGLMHHFATPLLFSRRPPQPAACAAVMRQQDPANSATNRQMLGQQDGDALSIAAAVRTCGRPGLRMLGNRVGRFLRRTLGRLRLHLEVAGAHATQRGLGRGFFARLRFYLRACRRVAGLLGRGLVAVLPFVRRLLDAEFFLSLIHIWIGTCKDSSEECRDAMAACDARWQADSNHSSPRRHRSGRAK